MARKKSAKRPRVFLNAGCGPPGNTRLPALFRKWKQIRVDVDAGMKPDIVANIADLSPIADASVDAVWSAHAAEHLYAHQVPAAFSEFRRVLKGTGFACIVVPDLQAIAQWIAEDRFHETIYQSKSGPVTAHDMVCGFGPAIASGKTTMAHHCGFTPTLFLERLQAAGFPEIVLRRRLPSLELVALALKKPSAGAKRGKALLAELGF
jgi:SAM-dependent methyltransferase